MSNTSGSGVHRADRPHPVVLRLLPHVHRPPARVLVVGGAGHEALALDARGYTVTLLSTDAAALDEVEGRRMPVLAVDLASSDFAGAYDLVCIPGGLSPDVLAAAARALRAGGQLFGAHDGQDVSALLHAVGPWFDAVRLDPSGFGASERAVVLVRR